MVVRWVSKPCTVTLDPQACAERIKNDESGEAHCTGQVRRSCRKPDGECARMGVSWLVWSIPLGEHSLPCEWGGACMQPLTGSIACYLQYFDYWRCVDKCVAPRLFEKLK